MFLDQIQNLSPKNDGHKKAADLEKKDEGAGILRKQT